MPLAVRLCLRASSIPKPTIAPLKNASLLQPRLVLQGPLPQSPFQLAPVLPLPSQKGEPLRLRRTTKAKLDTQAGAKLTRVTTTMPPIRAFEETQVAPTQTLKVSVHS
jgi:hypothetical protein